MRFLFCAVLLSAICSAGAAGPDTLLNASYDVSREFYSAFNEAYNAQCAKNGQPPITIEQSHDGSSKQARAVIDGLQADVVTMNQETDVAALVEAGLVAKDWKTRLPDGASPYVSTIVFLVRKDNPKGIKDWGDLVKPGTSVIIPNPQNSGNGRYSYLAEFPVSLVDAVVDKRGSRPLADDCLNFLWSEPAQRLAADRFLRPRNQSLLEENRARFPAIKLNDVTGTFGGWTAAQKAHFAKGGTFDQIYTADAVSSGN